MFKTAEQIKQDNPSLTIALLDDNSAIALVDNILVDQTPDIIILN